LFRRDPLKSSRIQQTPAERRAAEEQESVGVVPLGTPLLAGPGSISTAIIHCTEELI
jgi:multiple antibiotic resistance protein